MYSDEDAFMEIQRSVLAFRAGHVDGFNPDRLRVLFRLGKLAESVRDLDSRGPDFGPLVYEADVMETVAAESSAAEDRVGTASIQLLLTAMMNQVETRAHGPAVELANVARALRGIDPLPPNPEGEWRS